MKNLWSYIELVQSDSRYEYKIFLVNSIIIRPEAHNNGIANKL